MQGFSVFLSSFFASKLCKPTALHKIDVQPVLEWEPTERQARKLGSKATERMGDMHHTNTTAPKPTDTMFTFAFRRLQVVHGLDMALAGDTAQAVQAMQDREHPKGPWSIIVDDFAREMGVVA